MGTCMGIGIGSPAGMMGMVGSPGGCMGVGASGSPAYNMPRPPLSYGSPAPSQPPTSAPPGSGQ